MSVKFIISGDVNVERSVLPDMRRVTKAIKLGRNGKHIRMRQVRNDD